MAEHALKKLEDQLNCPICLDTYTDPKQLQCHHVFCQKCLVKLVIRDQQGELFLRCPNCRQATPIPANGVRGLQTAFQIAPLLEIVEEHKKAKSAAASAERRAETSSLLPVGCPEHDGREMELYCETCKEKICFRCIKKGEKHHSHEYEELKRVFERHEVEMSSLEPIEKQLTTIKRALAQLDARCEEICDQRATVETNINNTIGRLHEILDVRKTELIGQLHQLTRVKLESLAAQREQIETTQARLSSCLHFMRENLKTGNKSKALLWQVKELITTFQPEALKPNTEADIIFSASADLTTDIQGYGQLYEQLCQVDPPNCSVIYNKAAEVGKKSTTLLQAISINSRPCKEAINSITCELVSETTSTRVKGSVERRGQSQYEISYQPTIKGRHQLHITVEGQHIRGSPFPVIARHPVQVEKFDHPSQAITGINKPEGVAVTVRGEVLVTERNKHYISMLSPNGELPRSIGTPGSHQGQFDTPQGVAVDGEGCILVTDSGNHRIQKFTAEGEFIAAVGTQGSGPLRFKNPQGIAYNPSNGKVYVGDKNFCIQILNPDLSYVGSFGKKGNGRGEFNYPDHLAFDSTGNVYVADYNNNRIQVFTAEGEFLRMFGRHGKDKGELNGPNGLAIDSSDRVYVSEWENHRVSVFTAEGEFVTSFGRKGSSLGQFRNPTGLAVDGDGVLYVCDYHNDRVQAYSCQQ